MTHICVGKLTIIGSDTGLSPGRRQATICTNAEILLIGPLGTNFSGMLIEIDTISFNTMHLKFPSAKPASISSRPYSVEEPISENKTFIFAHRSHVRSLSHSLLLRSGDKSAIHNQLHNVLWDMGIVSQASEKWYITRLISVLFTAIFTAVRRRKPRYNCTALYVVAKSNNKIKYICENWPLWMPPQRVYSACCMLYKCVIMTIGCFI